MGEYAKYKDDQIKIGTCEDMYYLRYGQRNFVRPESGSVDVQDNAMAAVCRFRFPWPDEDEIKPGSFQDHDRSVPIHGLQPPEGIEHGTVQFRAEAGYLVSLPCPEDASWPDDGLTIHRNGFQGAVRLVRQKPNPDGSLLWGIFKCGGCGSMWRIEERDDIAPYLRAMLKESTSQCNRYSRQWWETAALRLDQGYTAARSHVEDGRQTAAAPA